MFEYNKDKDKCSVCNKIPKYIKITATNFDYEKPYCRECYYKVWKNYEKACWEQMKMLDKLQKAQEIKPLKDKC